MKIKKVHWTRSPFDVWKKLVWLTWFSQLESQSSSSLKESINPKDRLHSRLRFASSPETLWIWMIFLRSRWFRSKIEKPWNEKQFQCQIYHTSFTIRIKFFHQPQQGFSIEQRLEPRNLDYASRWPQVEPIALISWCCSGIISSCTFTWCQILSPLFGPEMEWI